MGCCAAQNTKTFLGASLVLFVFAALQGIRFPTNDVGNLSMKGGTIVNSGRYCSELYMVMSSNSGQTPFLLKPGHDGHGIVYTGSGGGSGFICWRCWF